LTPFRSEALLQLLQVFLLNHPNSSVIFSYAWHSNLNLKAVVVHAMAEWYAKAASEGDTEHNRLSRILDVAQDLKALNILLTAKAAPFVIDLAVMASRREYLNLEKWLTDQMREQHGGEMFRHGEMYNEMFVKAVITYLKRKLPALASPANGPLKEEHFAGGKNASGFPLEALPVMLLCLKSVISQNVPIQPEVRDAIVFIISAATPLLTRTLPHPQQQQQAPGGASGVPPPMPPGVLRPNRSLDPPSSFGGPPLPPTAVRPTPRPGIPSGFPPGPPGGGEGGGGGGPASHDNLIGLTNQFSGLGFGSNALPVASSAAGPASNSFNVPNVLGSLVSGPNSPSRMGSGIGTGQPPPVGMPTTSMDGGQGGGGPPSPFGGPPILNQPPPNAPASIASTGMNLPTSVIGSSVTTSSAAMPPSSAATSTGSGMQSGIEQIRTGNIAQIFPEGSSGAIPRDVEDEANSYFQKIYNVPPHPTLTIDQVLELLKKFQESEVKRDNEIFNCMIKNLFEEYKYFPQYPEKELFITAQLFGGIIEHGLVTMVPLGLALRFVLDTLRKNPTSNMFFFGITALDRFKRRLKDYPQYCQHISLVDHFKEFPAFLVKWVDYGAQGKAPPGDPPTGEVLPEHIRTIIANQSGQQVPVSSSAPAAAGAVVGAVGAVGSGSGGSAPTPMGGLVGAGPAVTSTAQMTLAITTTTVTTSTNSSSSNSTIVRPTGSHVGGRPSIANTTNIDTLLKSGKVQPKAPTDKICDKVAFIFNNLSLSNIHQKSEDLQECLADDFTGWLANYLVTKRASIEPNFHNLYSTFLDTLRKPELTKEVLAETYANINILLGSDKAVANFSDRALLKNLGHWLGLITLGKNRPILMIDLDIKPLIIEAFHTGQQELMYVVPFVAKVLEACSKSSVFKPPCPWSMGIMNLLAELHQEHDLKLNLKFEIEVLCKNLSIELPSLRPGTLLKDHDKLNKMLNFGGGFGLKPPPSHPGVQGTSVGIPGVGVAAGAMGGAVSAKAAMESFGAGTAGSLASLSRKALDMPPPQAPPPTSAQVQQSNSVNASLAAGALGIDISSDVRSSVSAPMGVPHLNMSQQPPASAASFSGMQHFGSLQTSMSQPQSSGMGMSLMSGGQVAASSQVASLGVHGGQGILQATQQQPIPQQTTQSQSAEQSGAAAAGVPTVDSQGMPKPFEPKFQYTEINTTNLNSITPHITIDARLTLMKDQPDLIQLVKIAIEKSIHEWVGLVVDRAIKVSASTCEQIVKKDFAMDHDENRLRSAAHAMVRNLTAGMAMITCRDHLLLSIKANLKNFMVTLGRNLTTQQQEAIDNTVDKVANDNVELACAFIQKKAIDKALLETDSRLKPEFEARLQARKDGRRYCDAEAATYQKERMPEAIRVKPGAPTPQQTAVYDEFVRNIPGFKQLTDREATAVAPKAASPELAAPPTATAPAVIGGPSTSDECVAILEEVFLKVDPFVQSVTTLPANPHMANLHALLEAMSRAKSTRDSSAAGALVDKAVENLLQGLTVQPTVDTESLAKYRDANLLVLRAIHDPHGYGPNWAVARVTHALAEAPEEMNKYNLEAIDVLVRSGLVNLGEYDKFLAKAVTQAVDAASPTGPTPVLVQFAMHLCKIYLLDERAHAHVMEADLNRTVDVLSRLASAGTGAPMPENLSVLMEMIQQGNVSGPIGQLHSGIQQAREFEDPPGLLEKTEYLLREWVNAYHSRDAGKDSRQAFVVFVQLMNQHGILKTDDLITRFFRMSTQMCVDLCYRALSEQNASPTLVRAKCFHTLDAYVRLITLLVKHSGETQNTITKVNLLNKVLGIVAGVLLIDHEVRSTDFQQVPYHRIFIMLFLELSSPDQVLENINFQVLTAYCNMLHILRPSKAPGFAYAWLEIVSHRNFMGSILAGRSGSGAANGTIQGQQQSGSAPGAPGAGGVAGANGGNGSGGINKGWPMYAILLVDLFKFLSPFLRNAELAKSVHRLYRGTLRVLLVLLHDFPEFLCDYHYSFCDVIPPNCIQMRNLSKAYY